MNTPRVTHVVVSLACGGLERLVVDWANARNARAPGATRIVCLDEAGELSADVQGGVIVLGAQRARRPFDVAAVRRLRRAAAETDVLHSHNLAAQQYAVLANVCRGVRHVHTEHGSRTHLAGVANRVRNRLLARFTDVLVAVSDATAESVSVEQGVPRERIRVIRNGVTPHRAAAPDERGELRARLGLSPGACVVGSIGRLDPVKGYDRLLRAFAAAVAGRVADTGTPLTLLLVGDGAERLALERQAADLGIAASVRFAGFRPDARRCLDVMDVFVLPSRSEGLSVALLEAMSAGVPVMATAVGETARVLEDGAAGVLLPDDDRQWVPMLSACIRPDGAAERAAMTARSLSRVAEAYSLEATLDAYERAYGGES